MPSKSIYFDVDNTLVMWPNLSTQESFENNPKALKFEFMGMVHWLKPHKKHIEELKIWHKKGHDIVIWSAGSKEWGEIVIDKLKLKKYIYAILSKPDYFYDDMPAHYILHPHRRIYKRNK